MHHGIRTLPEVAIKEMTYDVVTDVDGGVASSSS